MTSDETHVKAIKKKRVVVIVEWRGEEDEIMGGLGCAVGIGVRVEPNSWHYHHHLKAITVTRSGFPSSSSYSSYSNFTTTRRFRVPPHNNSQNREGDVEEGVSSSSSSSEWIRNSGIISSCLVGLLTGFAVVLFNNVVSSFIFIFIPIIHSFIHPLIDQYQYAGS